MKKTLLFTLLLMTAGLYVNAQSALFERYVMQNGTNDTIELSTGQQVIIATSSDDAEQEDESMDALYDDDLDIGWEGDPEKLHIVTAGLRFQNITIPRGATIDSAFVMFCSHEGKGAEDVAKITITAEASDNAATFDLDNLITARTQTSASALWTVAEDWELWEYYSTPDIKEMIQEVIDRSGWSYGNSLALIMKGENQGPSDLENAREMESFENIADPEDGGDGRNHPERAPKLMIYYTAPTFVFERSIVQNGANDTIELSTGELVIISTSSDDAEQEDDAMDALYDDDLDIGWEGDPEKLHIVTAGLRFLDVNIPAGVVIDSAFITFCVHEGKSAEDVAKITITGEASDNPVTYDLDNLITARPQTSASLLWTVAEDWGIWEFYSTPDISAIVQEIVDRSGWSYGNAMAFMLKGENQGPSDLENAREMESFENIADPEDGGDGKNHPERVPRLTVYYKSSTGINERTAIAPAFVLSPNPVYNGTVTVKMNANADVLCNVYNQQGALVMSQKMNKTATLNVAGLPGGLYVVTLNRNGVVSSQKLVIE